MATSLAIVVANWNGLHLLKPFLDSLAWQTWTGFDVVIVDNGSTDGSVAWLSAWSGPFTLRVVPLPVNTGFAHANNVGITAVMAAGADLVLTLNNDMELERDCIERLLAVVERQPGFAAYQLMQINHFDRRLIDGVGIGLTRWGSAFQHGYRQDLSVLADLPDHPFGVIAGAACYRASALRAVHSDHGYFDDRFFAYYEDVDLSLRLRARGARFLLVREAVVYHMHSGTGGLNSPFKAFFLSRNLFYYLKKNIAPAELPAILGYQLLRLGRELLGHLLARRWKHVAAQVRGLAQGLFTGPAGEVRRLSRRSGDWAPVPNGAVDLSDQV
ncbi:MAG: hypothetical protein RLY86_3064 [Pseudomonadota bacterium]|jgi:GT2 family glycosyltransferase